MPSIKINIKLLLLVLVILLLSLGALFYFDVISNWSKGEKRRAIDVVNKIKKPLTTAEDEYVYTAHWGNLELPVMEEEEPLHQERLVSFSLEDVLENINESVRFDKGKEEMELDLMALLIYPVVGRSPMIYYLRAENDFRLDTAFYKDIVKMRVENGAMVGLRGFIGNTAINSATMKIIDTEGPYRPPVYLQPMSTRNVDIYGFQLYSELGRNTLVRLDTTEESVKHIAKMYKDMEGYEVFHVPGFKTIRRFVSDRDKLLPAHDFNRRFLLEKEENTFFEIEDYPEYYDLKDKKVELKWGRMSTLLSEKRRKKILDNIEKMEFRYWRYNSSIYSMLPNENISIRAFKSNFKKSLRLYVDSKRYKILHFDCWITPQDEMATRFIANDITHPELLKAFDQVKSKTSIYFDNILIENEQGAPIYFPSPFLFNFED